jgi:hypothetical protein
MTRRVSRQKIKGRFLALPDSLIESRQFVELPHASRTLLILIARQYWGSNNGRLVATPKYLSRYAWVSNQSTTRCLRQLVGAGLIYQTRIGGRPNKAAWYGITWRELDYDRDMDIERKAFPRFIGTPLIPVISIAPARIAPEKGITARSPIPATGTIESDFAVPLSPARVTI